MHRYELLSYLFYLINQSEPTNFDYEQKDKYRKLLHIL